MVSFCLWVTFLLAAMSGSASRAEVRPDIEYGRAGGESLRLDASIPEGPGPFPAVVIVHGGGWIGGDRKREVEPLFDPLSRAGFAWFSISYRLATEWSLFGVASEDVRQAIRHIESHAGEYRIDAGRIAVIGESAGGQLAAMAVLRGVPDPSVRGVVLLYAPTDLPSLAATSLSIPDSIRQVLLSGPWSAPLRQALEAQSPVRFVRRDAPPFLLIHGTGDTLVPYAQSVRMCERIQEEGGKCELIPVKDAGHGLRWWRSTAYQQQIVAWLKQRLSGPRFNVESGQ